jgi:hypothetical protein
MIVWFFMGCDYTESVSDDDDSVDNNTFTYTLDLQGTVFDATDGSRLKGSSLSVTLTKGTTYYSPSLLKNGTSETTFAGDYAFTGVPTTLGGQVTYRIIVTMDGYQNFEGYITPNETEPTAAANNNTLDTVYNMIGNVYLFPLGETAAGVDVYVEYNNERVPGATVYLEQDTVNNGETAEANNNLVASTGQLTNLSATTDANGLASFAGSSLVLGGRYHITVLPTTYEGVQLNLRDEAVSPFIVGTTVNTQFVAMGDTVPGTEDNGLYIVSASNRDQEDITQSGVLTIVFSKPVGIVSERAFTAVLTNATHAVLASDPVAATMSADGLTLTLTPQFTDAGYVNPYAGYNTNGNGPLGTGLADINLLITYTGGQVYLLGDNQDDAMNFLTGADDPVDFLDGTDVAQTVQMTSSLDD